MSTVRASKWQTIAGVPVNNIIQLVQQDFTTAYSTTSRTMVDSGVSLAITPRFANSKILVIASIQQSAISASTVNRSRIKRTGPSTAYSDFAATTGTTSAENYTTVCYMSGSASVMPPNNTIYWLDTPASASACTYTVQFCINDATTARINLYGSYNNWGGTSHLTLMEIAQ